MGSLSLSRGSSQPRDWTQVSCIAGRFFTSWATREALPKLSSFISYFLFSYFFWDSTYSFVSSVEGITTFFCDLLPFFCVFVFSPEERIWLIHPISIQCRAFLLGGDFMMDHLRGHLGSGAILCLVIYGSALWYRAWWPTADCLSRHWRQGDFW